MSAVESIKSDITKQIRQLESELSRLQAALSALDGPKTRSTSAVSAGGEVCPTCGEGPFKRLSMHNYQNHRDVWDEEHAS